MEEELRYLPSDDTRLFPKESARVRRYRMLQSWYREHELAADYGFTDPLPATSRREAIPARPVGSLLAPVADERSDARNFLAPSEYATEILDYVNHRVPVVKAADGTLEETRLRQNMLSSMPLCFNVFAPLRNRPEAACTLLRDHFGLDAQHLVTIHGIDGIECEWAPPPESGIGDRSAFDAVVAYADSYERVGILGIETKYTDTFSPKEYAKPGVPKEAERRSGYIRHMQRAGWFVDGAADALWPRATNQMWRNTMLAGACEALPGVATAHVGVVHLFDDPGADAAIRQVRAHLHESDRVIDVPLERVLRNAPPELTDWAWFLTRRYTDLTPVVKTTEAKRKKLQSDLDRWFPHGCWATHEPWRDDPYEFGCARPIAHMTDDGFLAIEIWHAANWSGTYPAIVTRVTARGEHTEVEVDAGRWRLTSDVPLEFARPLAELRATMMRSGDRQR